MKPEARIQQRAAGPLLEYYRQVRQQSELACEPLVIEDYGLQAAAFSSPPKWHLAHTSWFFETFILLPFVAGYQSPSPHYKHLFNSYYNGVGAQFSRSQRGLLSRPTVDEVLSYRSYVDAAMAALLLDEAHPERAIIEQRVRLGLEHEQQHQELFFTDIKYSLSANPMHPIYSPACCANQNAKVDFQWRQFDGGLVTVGLDDSAQLDTDFMFDNEGPKHQVFLSSFALANRLVTNTEYQQFIDDGGYQRSELWLADGWAIVQREQWQQPLYWLEQDGQALHFTLNGLSERGPDQAVTHISGYEADAYACWAEARLPTEFEWEYAASQQVFMSADFNPEKLQAGTANGDAPLLQLFGDCWQWTGSAYRPYPGFKANDGAIGEYNGKFMANQWVLRGSSCVTQNNHSRNSYRNFFYPQDRWQFSGLRLAKDI